ncbi:MAG: hypothetical protein WBE30_06185, partial [Candidatus Cybelea sp.]
MNEALGAGEEERRRKRILAATLLPVERAITQATAGDLAAVAPLFDAYRAFFAGHPDFDESQRFLAERLATGDSVVFVAWRGDEAEGFIQLYP